MAPSKPTPAAPDRACPFITFYSFKGGVGRSMAVINVAGIVASRGFRVLVVDMDLEAPGLSFLANTPIEGEPPRLQPGFVDFMLDAVERGSEGDLFALSSAEAVDRYSAPFELPEEFRRNPNGSLHIMPAGRIDDGYSERLDRLDLPALYREGTGLALIHAFKQLVQDSGRFDYVFIDSRTGFSDESGICTRDLADCLMVVSGLNRQNVEGTTQFLSTLRNATAERKPLEVILSPIPNGEDALVDEREAAAKLAFEAAWGADVPTDLHIPYHPQLALTEEPHIFRRRRGYLFEAYNRIERRLLALLGDAWEGALARALLAMEAGNYATSEASLRRASMLADSQEWASRAAAMFDPASLVNADSADSIYRLLSTSGSSFVAEMLADRVARAASARMDKEPDIADKLFKKALSGAPNSTITLGRYAWFLWQHRNDLDAAESMFRRALDTGPTQPEHFRIYGNFLQQERQNYDLAESMYKRALGIAPENADTLASYATLLWESERSIDDAEQMYKRSLAIAPDDAGKITVYASFLWFERKDIAAAEASYRRATIIAPNHPNNLGNYGGFHLANGRIAEGRELIDRALTQLDGAPPGALHLECWMYLYCCGEPQRQAAALPRLRTLVERDLVKTGTWSFAEVIHQAQLLGHPEASWLPRLAEVLSGRELPASLDDWPAWREACPSNAPDKTASNTNLEQSP